MTTDGAPEHVLVTVSSGRGPVECQRAVRLTVREIIADARSAGLAAESIGATPGEDREHLSATVEVRGDGAAAFARSWEGTVQWRGRSPFRPNAPRARWFVGVTVDDAPAPAPTHLGAVRVEQLRSGGGAGGQHKNKVSTAVRLTHEETGEVVTASAARSLEQNRRMAWLQLERRLLERRMAAETPAARAAWRAKTEIERGNPVRSFDGLGPPVLPDEPS